MRQLEERQRIPVRLGDELLGDALVERPAHHRAEQLARVDVRKSLERQLRQASQRVELVRLTLGEHEDDRLGCEAPGNEGEHL